MELNHLSEPVVSYIKTNLSPGVGFKCLNIFVMAEKLGLEHYEESFVGLVGVSDNLEQDDTRDIFIEKVERLAIECIEGHGLKIDLEASPSLDDLVEIMHFLVLVPTLEDYSVIELKLFSQETPRQVFTHMVSTLSGIEQYRALEVIEEVSENLIKAMQDMVNEKNPESPRVVNHAYLEEVNIWRDFLGAEQPSIGVTMFESGFVGLDFKQLTALMPLDLNEYLPHTLEESVAQGTLDFISLLMVCRDTFQTPLLIIQKKISDYIGDQEMVTRIHLTATKILGDYQTHKEAYVQKKLFEERSQ